MKVSTINKPKKYNFIGHVVYPNVSEIQSMFFKNHISKRFNVLRKSEIILIKCVLTKETLNVLEATGYTVVQNNKKGVCTINNISGIRVKAKVDPDTNEVLVSVVAKNSMELTDNVRTIVDIVKKKTGIKGVADIYTKMEMC